jgi:DNA-directed RNA polymerase specialized sigma24 family protein
VNDLSSVKRELQTEVRKLDRIRKNKEKLFQKLMDDKLTDDEYVRLSEELELEEITVEDKIRELKKKQKAVLVKKNEKEINVKVYKEIGEIKKIDRNVVEKLINKIIVNKEGGVEIQWTFKEIFQSA